MDSANDIRYSYEMIIESLKKENEYLRKQIMHLQALLDTAMEGGGNT